MKITMLGTGTSYPDPNRVQSGILVETENESILLDIGSGILHRLTQVGHNLDRISSVFISHFHIDHCSDFLTLCQSIWLTGTRRTLNLYGPPFVIEWLHSLHKAFPYLSEKVIINPIALHENGKIKLEKLTVENTPTVHGKTDTRAFRIESEGTIFVYSSDTAPCHKFNSFASNVDILVHECNWLDGTHPKGVHTAPSELKHIMEEVVPTKLILTHLSPEVVQNKKEVLEIIGIKTETEVIMAEDLMSFES
jgi:ribonuclease BN (tRNA processing enzyme)